MAVIGLGPIGIEMASLYPAWYRGGRIRGWNERWRFSRPACERDRNRYSKTEFSVHLGEKADLEAVKGEAGGGVRMRVRAKEREASTVDSVCRLRQTPQRLPTWGIENLVWSCRSGRVAARQSPHTMPISAIYPFSLQVMQTVTRSRCMRRRMRVI